MPRYLVVGDIGIDYITLADGKRLAPLPGGAALYAAVGCAIWDRSVGVSSTVNRTFPQAWLDAFTATGIDLRGVRRHAFPVGLEVAFTYQTDGSRTGSPGNPTIARLMHHFPSLFHAIGGAVINRFISPLPANTPSDYQAALAMHITPMLPSRQKDFIQWAQTRAITLDVFAPSRMGYTPVTVLPPLSALAAFLPSEAEISEIYPHQPLNTVVQDLRVRGAATVCIKRGRHGAVLSTANDLVPHAIPIYPTPVRDVTGAGDAFCGGFLVGLQETGDPLLAALYGTVSASFVIEGSGPHFALGVTRTQAEARLAWLHKAMCLT